MLFRIEAANGATRPCKTSLSCKWDIPSGNKISIKPTTAEELFFEKQKYNSSNTAKQKTAKLKFNAYKPSLHSSHQKQLQNKHEIRSKGASTNNFMPI